MIYKAAAALFLFIFFLRYILGALVESLKAIAHDDAVDKVACMHSMGV